MEIIINKNEKLKDIQEQFSKHYPYLKIEFYKSEHEEGEGSAAKNKLDNQLSISDIQQSTKDGLLHVRGAMKVSEIENDFAEQFGLSAQIFRKSGDIWLQTTSTDEWTLIQQNQAAAEMNETVENPKPGDYHEQE